MEWNTEAAVAALIAAYVSAYWVGYRRGKRVVERRWREWMDKCLKKEGEK